MSSFIGAALPWMGGKVSDLLGFAGREEGGGDGLADENNGAGKSSGDGIGGDDGPSSASGSTVFPPSPLSSRRDVSASPRVSRVIRGRGRATKARHHPRLAVAKAPAAPSSPPEVIDVTEEYTSGGSSSRESPAHAPVRRVRGRSQGSSPEIASTAGTSDGIIRREGDYRYSSGGNTPQRTGSLGATRRDVDWRIPWTGGTAVAANARRRSFSVSPASVSSTARAPMASTFWETGNSTVAGASGCRRASFGGGSSSDCSGSGVKKDGSPKASTVYGDGSKKRRAETAGIDGQNFGSGGGGGAAKVKKRDREGLPTFCELAPGKGEGVSAGGVAGRRGSAERNRSGSGDGADGSRMGPSSREVRSVSKTAAPAAGVAGAAASGIAKERELKGSGKESREPESSWKADFFSSGESDVYQEPVQEKEGSKTQDEQERLLRSPPCGTPDRADTTWPPSLNDEDDDGPGVGGYNGSLIANGAGGNTWRAPRRQKSLSAVFSSGSNKALVPAPLPRSRPRLPIGEGNREARPCDGSDVVNGDGIGSGNCSSNGGSSGSEGSTSSGVSSSESVEDSGKRQSDDGSSPSSPPASSDIATATSATSDADGDAATKPVAPGRLAWCGDRRLLPRPSATLQLRRNAPKSSLSSSSAAAYLGRLDLTVESRRTGSRRGSRGISTSSVYSRIRSRRYSAPSGVRTRTGELMIPGEGDSLDSAANGDGEGVERGGSESASKAKAAAAAATAAAVYAADDAVTLSSSCMSVTSGEESDSDEVLMMVDDQDDPDFASGVFDGGDTETDAGPDGGETDGTTGALDEREGEEKPSGTATANVVVIAGEAAGSVSETGKNDAAVAVKEGAGVAGVEADGSAEPVAVSDAGGVEDANLRSSSSSSPVEKDDDSRLSANSSSSVKTGKGNKKQNRRKNGKANQSTAAIVVARPGVNVHAARDDSAADAGERRSRAKPKSRSAVEDPLVPPQPPSGPRKWPARPPHRALVYAAAAEASRRARGFTGWSFPALPPPPPPPPTPSPPPTVLFKVDPEQTPTAPPSEDSVNAAPGDLGGCADEVAGGKVGGRKGRGRMQFKKEDVFLGFAKDNPPGKPSPNEFGWMALDPMHTAEGRAAAKKRALLRKRRAIELAALRKREELERRRQELERIALQKRQEILDALKIKEEIAEARRKRKLNILFLGMTRVAEYDSKGGLTKGMKRFDLVEKMVRQDVDETNMNPLRDTARVLAMEALGHEVRCISKVSTPGESDSESSRSTRAKGGPTGLGRFLATDMTNTGASRGFLRRIEEKWSNITFDTVLLDHYWLPDSVVWLNKGYMANDGGLIQNLVKMTTTKLLRDDFEIMLPINQAFFELLLPHFKDLEKHFTVEFLVGERLEHLKRSHLALEADDLIPADVMLNTYGKQREHQVSQMLGVKQPTAEVAAILLKYGVAAQHFCYARFLKLSRNPPPHPALAAVALTAASESAKIAEEAAKIAAEQAELAAQSAKEISEFDQKENRAAAANATAARP